MNPGPSNEPEKSVKLFPIGAVNEVPVPLGLMLGFTTGASNR